MARIPFKPDPHAALRARARAIDKARRAGRELAYPTIPNKIRTPLDLFDNPITGPDPDPIRTKPPDVAPKAMPKDPLGEWALDADPMGRFTLPESDPLDAIQQMLELDPVLIPHGPLAKPLPDRKSQAVTTMPDPYRRWNDGRLTREFEAAERNRDLPPNRQASDVADPLAPVDEGEGVEAWNRAYVPGEIEKMLTTGLDPEVSTEATEKLTSLAGRMGQDEYIRLVQELDAPQDRTGQDLLETINSALSLTFPEPNPRLIQPLPKTRREKILDTFTWDAPKSDPLAQRRITHSISPRQKASLPIEAMELDTEIPNPPSGGRQTDPKQRIKRQWVGEPRTERPGHMREDIGRPVKETPWGEHKISFAENPMGREVAVNVGEVVEVAGSPLRGKVLSITGGPKKVDTKQLKAEKKGEFRNVGAEADDLDFSNMDYVTTQINAVTDVKGGGKPYLQRKQALKAQMARVEMADGTIATVPLSRVKRVGSPKPVEDPALRNELLDIERILRDKKSPTDLGALYESRGRNLPRDTALFAEGGKSAPNPSASKNRYYRLLDDYPSAGGKFRVQEVDFKGRKRGEPFEMGEDEALRRGVITEPAKARRGNTPPFGSDEDLQKLGNSAKLAKHGTKEGAVGGTWRNPPEVGSVHRIQDEGQDLLVQVEEVSPREDRKIDVKWKPIAERQGARWVRLAGAATAVAGAALLDKEEAEAARIPINPKMGQIMTAGTAPTISVPNTSTKMRAARATYDTFFPAVEGSRILEKTGKVVDPENAPHNTLPLNIRGGQAPQEEITDEIIKIIEPFRKDADLRSAFEASTNYKSYQNAINTVKDKAGRARAEAAHLYAEGNDSRADSLTARAMGFEERLKENRVVPGGYDEATIAAELAELESHMTPEQRVVIDQAQKGLYQVTRKLLKAALDEGLISNEQFLFYAGRGDNYLPLYRLSELFDPATGTLIKKQFLNSHDIRPNNARVSLLDEDVIDQELMGSDKPNRHPIEGLMKYVDGLVGEIQRNKAAKSVLTFYDQNQEKIKSLLHDYEDMKLYEMQKVGNVRPTGEPPEGKAYVGYMDKGLPVYYLVDKDLATTLTFVEPEILRGAPALTSKIRAIAHMFTASANPAFMATQVPMDTLSAMIKPNYTKYDKTPFITDVPGFLYQVGKEAAANYIQKFTGKDVKGLRNLKYAHEPERRMASAGSVNTFVDPKARVFGFRRGVLAQEATLGRKIVRSVIEAGSQVQDKLLEPLERSIKSTTYDTLRDRRFKPVEAGAETRVMGGSPDFQRYGTLTEKYKNDILFLNPAVQGLAAMVESANRNPQQWVKTATLASLSMMGIGAWNAQFIDENGQPEIEKVPLSDRQNNLIFFYGEPELQSTGDYRTPYIKVPMPHELRALMSPLVAVLNGAMDENYSAGQGALDVLNNFIPIGQGQLSADSPGEFVGSVGRKIGGSLNPLYRYPLEVGTGTEFFSNTPIVGSRVAGNIPEYEYTLRTPPGAVVAGKALGMSPDRLNHLLRTVAPGLGQMALEGASMLTGSPERPTAALESDTEASQRAPVTGMVARRFSGTLSTNADISRKKDVFYSFADRTQSAASTISSQSGRNPWELQNITESTKILAALNPEMVRFRNTLSELDKAREVIIRHPGLAPADKQLRLQRLFDAEERVVNASQEVVRKFQQRLGE